MIKKETVLFYANGDDEKILLSHLYDNYVKAFTKNYNTYSDFFSEEKTTLIKTAFSTVTNLSFDTYGGYEGAERVISAFLANEDNKRYPVLCIEISGRGISKLSHRDFLGALMGLGIKREMVGDIVIGEKCYVFVKEEIADYILLNLTKVGNLGVSVGLYNGKEIIKEERFEIISSTVESLRLDLIVARGFNIKRSDASKFISQGKVLVSGREVLSNDYKVKQNDKITLKGKGKIVFLGENGVSKKGKIIIDIKRYI